MSAPRISVVTAVLNRASFIRTAVDSVLAQGLGDAVEHIVIDGGSTDGTLEILRDYPHLQLFSGPDDGLYDAMNKGIRVARGDLVALLNSDDRFPADSLRSILEADTMGVDMLVGRARIIDAMRSDLPAVKTFEPAAGLRLFDVTRGVPFINARFTRRSVYDRIGSFDQRYPLAADREWLLRAWRAGIRARTVAATVYDYAAHPGSLTIGGDVHQAIDEHLAIAASVLGDPSAEPALRREMGRWRAQVMARDVRDRWRQQGPPVAIGQAAHYLKREPSWPLRAVFQRLGRHRGPQP